MYFTTFNHDDEYFVDDNFENEVCLICWESSTNNNSIVKMKSVFCNSDFSKACLCNGLFHYDCLLKWIKNTHSCPICRIKIQTNMVQNKIFYLTNKSQIFRFINFTNMVIYKLLKLFFLFLVLKTIYDITNDIQYITNQEDDQQCII
jgi:hypothetical protein